MRVLALFLTTLITTSILCPGYAQVTADFVSNVNTGCGSLQVSFTDLSSSSAGNIVSWSWDLGGVASTGQNPGRIFGTPGSYTICLTATDNAGNTNTECKQNFITVYNLPQPAFSSDSQFGCAPVEITFTDESTSIDGNIVEWIWGLGGTSGVVIENGSSPEVSSVYENPDAYTMSLTVTDDNGCINTITETDFLTVYDFPVIDISLSDSFSCTSPFIVTASNNSPAPNINYFWDFGNGFPIFEGTNPPSTFYSNEGSYTITVIAENSLTNCVDTLVLQDIINVGNAVSFTHTPDEGCEDLSVSFSNTSITGVSNIQWDFGDGSSSSDFSPTHVYTSPGCYTVTLSSLINGCVDTYTSSTCIEVFPLPGVSLFNDNEIGCSLPHTVNFAAFSNTAIVYSWNFGDNTTSGLQNPTHTYTEFGLYPVSLEVTDANGCTSNITDTIEIFALEAQMNLNTISGCSPVDFTLTENSISITPVNSWYWEVDTAFSDPNSPLFTSTDQVPSFSLVDTGWYDVTLIVTNTLGCVDTFINYGAVGVGIPPIVNFSASPLIACVDESIQFTDLSSDYGDGWFWDFGDGTFSFEQNPTHAYNSAPDTFDVTLVVENNGCQSVITFENYIIIEVPVAGFELDRNCNTPNEISFINNSVGADSTFWHFGYADDGSDTSSVLDPVVTYPGVGCYTATQIVYNYTTACVDSFELEFCITDPEASFSLSPLSGCSPLSVNVTNNSIFDVAWNWTAPGASISNAFAENPVITYQNPGIYSEVQLIVTDMNNCQDTIVFTDDILVDGVFVDFESLPSGGCQPLSVSFLDNSSSFISPLASWSWDIGEGLANSTEQNTSYFFPDTGAYAVSLTVTNEWGCVSTLNVPDAVNVTTVEAGFTADLISCPMDSILFTDTSVGADLSYNWDFGDGNFSNESNPFHQFLNPGVYNVCLTITDFAGCEGSHCQTINIVSPTAAFTIDTAYANCPPLVVTFENQSINGIFYEWDFGDNSGISDLENPQHVYTVPGIYDVQLIVTINENCTDTLFLEDLIELEGPVGDFFFDEDTACISEFITFIGASEDDFTYIWDFGDGILDTTFNVSNDTVFHAYTETGAFVPKLTLVDSENCLRTLESPDTIYIGLLDIDFIASDSTLCEGVDEVHFLNLVNTSSALTDLLWIFENGNPPTSTDFEPTVTFPNVGNFDVSLIVANAFCSDTLIKEDYIGAGALPVADFTSSSTSGCIPLNVQYFDQSTVSTGAITSWEWTFGELGTSTLQNPSYTYGVAGDFDVNLIVTTEFGCSDTTSNEATLYEAAEVILFLSEPDICIGDVTQLGATFQIDTTGLEFYWQSDPTLSCLDCLDPLANPIVTTSYFFISTTSQGCSDTSEIIVTVLPYAIPEIFITSDTTLCTDESIQLNAFSPGMVTYEWDQNGDSLSCYNNCNDPIANPVETTLYYVTVTNSFGCDDVDSVLVEVVDQNQPFAGDDRTICEGDSVQLSLIVDGNPFWLNSNSLSCNDCNDPIAFPEETTSYIVQTITADFSCDIMDTITVNVLGIEDIDAGDDIQMCLGESITLNAATNSPGTIIWTPSTGLDDDTVLNPTSSAVDTTTYFLSITEDLCVLTDSVEVVIQYVTEVESFDYEICAGDTVQLSFIGEADNIFWSPDETLSDGLEESPLAFPLETTQYTLTANLSTCEEDTALANVIVNQGPEISMPASYDKFPGVDVQIELEVLSGNGDYTFEWLRFDGLSCNNCPNPVLSADTSGFYTVIVYDEVNGCFTSQQVFINLLRRCNSDLISVPNIFTPNDDGYNDKTEIFSEAITEIYVFRVYSRWGALIFETNDILEGWDGKYKGKLMPSGVYVYYLQAPCSIDGSTFLKKGDITLLR